MIIAQQKRKENIIEYLLYMWQVEDIIRACNLEIKPIEKHIISKFDVDADTQLEIRDWYLELIQKMKDQGITKKGHLEELYDVMNELNFLHHTLLNVQNDKKYNQLFATAEPNIELLRKKSPETAMNFVENCLTGVYGLLVLRLKKKQVSESTEAAINTISALLAYLAAKYKQIKRGNNA